MIENVTARVGSWSMLGPSFVFIHAHIVPRFTIAQALAFALAASLAGAIYPALKASRMSITRALQQR